MHHEAPYTYYYLPVAPDMDPASVPLSLDMTAPEKSSIPCLVCRSRKVRCDKTLPECRNCERLGVKCPRYSVDTQAISRSEIQKSADDIFKAAGVEKRRVGSCEECRASKHRCTRTRPSCRRCMNKGLKCTYPDKHDKPDSHHHGQSTRGLSSESSPLSQGFQGPIGVQHPQSPDASSEFGIDRDQLYSETLPDDPALRLRLVEAFFDRSHPLRCLSFLDKSSFMQALECDSVIQDYGQPVLYAVCALGARHIHFDHAAVDDDGSLNSNMVPGQGWAERARKDVLGDIHTPTVNHVMAMVLLCDYGIRADQNSMVFVLISFLYRVVRLLGIDDPEPLDPQADYHEVMQRDTENRLVWACYFIDLFMATGVDKNACWKDIAPAIPLPSLRRPFASQGPLPQHTMLTIDKSGVEPAVADMNLAAISVLVIRLRMIALRLIRTEPQDLPMPVWDPSSPFLQTIQKLDNIYQNLPERYHLNDANIPILKEQRLLGGVFFLHCLLHSVVSDITRPSLPGYGFPLAGAFQSATPDFRSQCQERCRFHASQITSLLRKGMSYGRVIFDDPFPLDAALEAVKIQIIYAAAVNQAPEVIQETSDNVSSMLYFFSLSHRGNETQSPYVKTLMPLCFLFGFRDVAEPYRTSDTNEDEAAEVTGSAEIDHLSRFAPFRRARYELKARSSNSTRTSSSRHTQSSPTWDHRPNGNIPESGGPEGDQPRTLPSTDYPNYIPGPAVPADPRYYPNAQGPVVPPMNGMGPPEVVVSQPSMDDYVRTADQMAGYLTWDTMEVPPWLNYGNMFPSG